MSDIEQLEKELKIAQLKVNEEKYRRNARKQEEAADASKKQWLDSIKKLDFVRLFIYYRCISYIVLSNFMGVFWIRLMLDSYPASRRRTWLRKKVQFSYMAIKHVLRPSVSKAVRSP